MEWIIQQVNQIDASIKERHVGSILEKVLQLNGDNQLDRVFPLNDFMLFKDSQKVLDRIEKAIADNEKIVIYGDYDCDGILATTILYQTLYHVHYLLR